MRCPVCQAQNDQGPNCRRCRVDLSLLFTLEEQRERALGAASWCALHGQPQRAQTIAAGAQVLRRGADAQAMLAVASLLARKFARAWDTYTSFPDLFSGEPQATA